MIRLYVVKKGPISCYRWKISYYYVEKPLVIKIIFFYMSLRDTDPFFWQGGNRLKRINIC